MNTRSIAVIGVAIVLASAGFPGVVAAAARHSKPLGTASLRVSPRCVSVRPHHKKQMTITLSRADPGKRYTFAMVPLFGGGVVTAPNVGRHRANGFGAVKFTYPAPNQSRDAGRWQVSATRRTGPRLFKLAAVTHFLVKAGKCKRR
jgi:hypothetical protein